MGAFQSKPEFLCGRDAEIRVGEYLKPRGWFLFPASEFSGANGERAPVLDGADRRIVVPDFGMARSGRFGWAEVKAKWDATYTIVTGQWEHGIGLRSYRHYRDFEQQVGAPVWLFIVELKRGRLLYQTLNDLDASMRIYDGDAMDPGGMVFWPRNAFDCVVLEALPGLFDAGIPLKFEVGA